MLIVAAYWKWISINICYFDARNFSGVFCRNAFDKTSVGSLGVLLWQCAATASESSNE